MNEDSARQLYNSLVELLENLDMFWIVEEVEALEAEQERQRDLEGEIVGLNENRRLKLLVNSVEYNVVDRLQMIQESTRILHEIQADVTQVSLRSDEETVLSFDVRSPESGQAAKTDAPQLANALLTLQRALLRIRMQING